MINLIEEDESGLFYQIYNAADAAGRGEGGQHTRGYLKPRKGLVFSEIGVCGLFLH